MFSRGKFHVVSLCRVHTACICQFADDGPNIVKVGRLGDVFFEAHEKHEDGNENQLNSDGI